MTVLAQTIWRSPWSAIPANDTVGCEMEALEKDEEP